MLKSLVAAAWIASSLQLPSAEQAQRTDPFPIERQILWQRSVDDALAISKVEGRPILVAVNMDGESACERIVRERYRDPAFVGWTRSFVCVIASAFRHAPRDHDERGARIPCPRLGEVTCGEHIALEPVLFDRFLGGERIAPRHALILADGTNSFDLFLLFDMRELDKKLEEAVKLAPPPPVEVFADNCTDPFGQWSWPAQRKQHRKRLAFETALLDVRSEPDLDNVVAAISKGGDAGSVEALRILLSTRPPPSASLVEKIQSTAHALKIEAQLATVIRERLAGLGEFPGAPGLADETQFLPLLGSLDGASAATRTLLLARSVLGDAQESASASRALGLATTPDHVDVTAWWSAMRDAAAPSSAPAPAPDDLPDAETLERELVDLDGALGAKPDDPALLARYGQTTLGLARRRMESGGPGAKLLLEDADRFLARAREAGMRDVSVLLARTRTAYLLGRFEEQEQLAEEASKDAKTEDERIEALRWLGDASARLLAQRSGGDVELERAGIARGVRALTEVAASPEANETDWISIASFLGALGMRREELAILQLGTERLPASTALRNAFNGALASGGRTDLAGPKAEWLVSQHADSPECAWWAGYARILQAEDARREEEPDRAIAEYGRAEHWFRECSNLKPDYSESTRRYLAVCSLGRGFAHLLADRRADAALCLSDAIELRPAIASERDGLDREPIDLLDGALEWRESGPSPVVPGELLDALERGDAGNPMWARSISDAELREALRADGRGDVDAADAYLTAAIEAGRAAAGLADEEENRRALAQVLTVAAERWLERGDTEQAAEMLVDAAPLLSEQPPSEGADKKALEEIARSLRQALGAARPRFRPGR